MSVGVYDNMPCKWNELYTAIVFLQQIVHSRVDWLVFAPLAKCERTDDWYAHL
jgi:hypothetical protein